MLACGMVRSGAVLDNDYDNDNDNDHGDGQDAEQAHGARGDKIRVFL
jgi:hypothetical protein